jgi:hypothetical protein
VYAYSLHQQQKQLNRCQLKLDKKLVQERAMERKETTKTQDEIVLSHGQLYNHMGSRWKSISC